jgi:MFS transporter, DHA1 family, inner membrane transport protein
MTRKQIILLALLALIQFTSIVDFMIVMPLGPILKNLWGISSTQFSRIVSLFSLGAFISAMACVAFVDRFDRKKVLMLVYAGFTIGTFCCGLAQNYEQLLVARFLTGLFGGIGGSIILSIVGDSVAPEHRGQAMGILMMGFSLASIIGVPGGLWLAAHYQWHTPFMILAGLCTIVFLGILFLLPNFTSHLNNGVVKQNIVTIFKNIFGNANMRWALLLGVLGIMSHFSIIPFLTDFYTNNLGFDFKTTVPFIYIVGGLITVVTSPLIGKLSDKLGRLKMYSLLTVLAAFPLLLIPNLHTDSKYILLAVSATLFVFSGSRMIISSAQITGAVSMQQRGSFLIINSSMQQLATGITAAMGGAIITNDADKNLQHYPILGIIGVCFGIAAWVVFKQVKKVA